MFELVFDAKEKELKNKRKNLLAELNTLDEEAPLPSEIYMKAKEEKKKEKEKEEPKKIDIISESIYDSNCSFGFWGDIMEPFKPCFFSVSKSSSRKLTSLICFKRVQYSYVMGSGGFTE